MGPPFPSPCPFPRGPDTRPPCRNSNHRRISAVPRCCPVHLRCRHRHGGRCGEVIPSRQPLHREGDISMADHFPQNVHLTVDIPELELRSGDAGTVCSAWSTAWEVEFRKPGIPYATRVLLTAEQIQVCNSLFPVGTLCGS